MSFKDKWARHSVAIPTLTRTIHRIVKADDWTKENKKGVHVNVEEMVHAHDVYRLKKEGSDKVDSILWHRGAKVGVA
jgi:hypothetical protein